MRKAGTMITFSGISFLANTLQELKEISTEIERIDRRNRVFEICGFIRRLEYYSDAMSWMVELKTLFGEEQMVISNYYQAG